MAAVMLDEFISDVELANCRERYNRISLPSEDDQFQFALSLIRSKQKKYIEEGLSMFQVLFSRTKNEDVKRDSLYYMAIAETKLNNYEKALKYLQSILNIQPTNEQVRDLYVVVNNRMKRDGLIGMGIVGSALFVGVVGIASLGAALLAKR
jgi:fission 1 protein